MAKIVSRARQLRLEYQAKVGRPVNMQEVAEAMGMSRTTLNLIELNQTRTIDFDTLLKFCTFYTEALGRYVGVGDVLEFDLTSKRAPSVVALV